MSVAEFDERLANEDAAAEADYRIARQREMWRKRLLPLLGVSIALAIWAALVYIFKVPPFVAPSPLLVATTLYAKFGVLMANLLPTAIESVSGFLLGNFAAISLATAQPSSRVRPGAGEKHRVLSGSPSPGCSGYSCEGAVSGSKPMEGEGGRDTTT